MALLGLRKGLIASALSAAGVIGGAVIGARLGPHLLSGGSRSPYTPVAALAGALILAIACEAGGLAVEGSGWVARPELVVTAAHVVAGEHDTSVDVPRSSSALHATPVAVDARNDVAVLRVPGLSVGPLRLVDPVPGAAVAILGYPGDGPFDAKPGRIGRTATVLSQDAYGRGPVARTITSIRGVVRHGDSGGPAVDSSGHVQTTIFAARVGSTGGYGVPSSAVRLALAGARGPVSTGPSSGQELAHPRRLTVRDDEAERG